MKKNTCQFCRSRTEDGYMDFIAMTMPIPKMEKLKEKYGHEFWLHLEREDLSDKEREELDKLCLYDQALNTIGRGFICLSCLHKENELLEKYHPEPKTND